MTRAAPVPRAIALAILLLALAGAACGRYGPPVRVEETAAAPPAPAAADPAAADAATDDGTDREDPDREGSP